MLKAGYYGVMNALAHVEQRHQLGTSIFDSNDWDVCIILDSCRFDMFNEAWDGNVDSKWSVGSVTTEWLANTFHTGRCDVSDLGFVSATPHSSTVFRDGEYLTSPDDAVFGFPTPSVPDPSLFDGFYEVWRSHAGEYGAVAPETMVDATLEAVDRHDRVVSHWMQPHEPFIAPGATYLGGSATEKNVWTALQNGDVKPERVWPSYQRNLEYALANLRQLVSAVDGTVLVTSDHGNAFGQFGVYGHPFGWPEPAVRRVPWLKLTGEGNQEYSVGSVLDATQCDTPVEDHLRALGYR